MAFRLGPGHLLHYLRLRQVSARGDIGALLDEMRRLSSSAAFRPPSTRFAPLREAIARLTDIELAHDFPERMATECGRYRVEQVVHGIAPPEVFGDLATCEEEEILAAAVGEGRGAVVFSAHMCHANYVPNKLRALGFPAKCLVNWSEARRSRVSWVDRLVLPNHHRELSNRRYSLSVSESFVHIIAHISHGGVLVVLGDGRGAAHTSLPFLGGTWKFAAGFHELLHRMRTPTVTAAVRRDETGRPVIRLGSFPPTAAPDEGVRSYRSLLDTWVREAPECWRHLGPFLADAQGPGYFPTDGPSAGARG